MCPFNIEWCYFVWVFILNAWQQMSNAQFLFFRWCYTIQLNIIMYTAFAYTIFHSLCCLCIRFVLANLHSLVPTIFASWFLGHRFTTYEYYCNEGAVLFGFILSILYMLTDLNRMSAECMAGCFSFRCIRISKIWYDRRLIGDDGCGFE